ncbi:TRAP transporter small permease [Pseudooceanicola nitratireducens]|uniref:TRAP transporter small permease n=1 Tax=Pseudooceanicola nitratireducens TaxID=517719 RepID=UPI0035198560
MQSFFKVLRQAEDVFMGLAGLAALGLVCFDVVTRYFFPAYLQDWTGEVTIYLTAAAMLLGGGLLVQENRHIRADLFTRRMPMGVQRVLECAAVIAGLVFCLLVAWYGVKAVEFSQMLDVRSESSIQFPLWIFYLCLPIAFGLMALRYLHRLYVVVARFDPAILEAEPHEHPKED